MDKENKLPKTILKELILICKEAHHLYAFLSDFEEDLVRDTIRRYARYGKELRLSPKQIDILLEIQEKLYIERR